MEMLQAMLKFIKQRVLLVAFVILGALNIYQYYHSPAPKVTTKVEYVPTIIYKDKDGKENAKVQEQVLSKKEMKEVTKEDKKRLHATQINSETNIVDHNSLTMRDDTISIKRYDTRKWLLGATKHEVNITHSDTSIHSIAAKSITFKEPRVLFVVGPYVGATLIQGKIKPSFGISATLNILQFKARK